VTDVASSRYIEPPGATASTNNLEGPGPGSGKLQVVHFLQRVEEWGGGNGMYGSKHRREVDVVESLEKRASANSRRKLYIISSESLSD
jgi:hypothetical protein